MRIPRVFIPEKNLNDKIQNLLKKLSEDRQPDNMKYAFRSEIRAVKNDKEFLITYSIPQTGLRSETVKLKISQSQPSEEDFDELIDLANGLCSHHQLSLVLLGHQKKNDKTLGVCTAYSKNKIAQEDLVKDIISFYTTKIDRFKILKTIINNEVYKDDELLLNYIC